jgi:hypothetical protein
MTNEIMPEAATSWLDNVNLPKLLAGPAGQALSRLVGHVIDVPAAKIQQVSQEIRDKTEAKSIVSRKLANEAAKVLAGDPVLVQRAAENFLAKELRRQANKEAIAHKTIELLTVEPPQTTPEENIPPEDDWMNLFERYAEDASSDRLRAMWAKILAGEIRTPRSFSLQTLRFISELDQETASNFEELSNGIIGDQWIPKLQKFREGPFFEKNLSLEEAGLVSGAATMISQTYHIVRAGPVALSLSDNSFLLVNFDGARDVRFNGLMLTRIGREIAAIVRRPLDDERLAEFSEFFRQDGVVSIVHSLRQANDPNRYLTQKVLWQNDPKPNA